MSLKSTFVALVFALRAFAQSPMWGQCGGIGWTGPTICVAGATCTYLNDWHYQCLPDATTTPTPTPPSSTTATTTTTTTSGLSYPSFQPLFHREPEVA